jgi:membrane associated rhomboid family serine protease
MSEVNQRREKVLNLPEAITWLLVAFVAVHVLVVNGPVWLSEFIFDRFAFVPARFAFLFAPDVVLERLVAADQLTPNQESRLGIALNAGWSGYVSPISYAFLHGDWTHLGVNALSLTAFGSPVARRLGSRLFLSFAACCAVAGAMTHLALHTYDLNPVVGASAAISGTMGAIARFAFRPGARMSPRPAGSPGDGHGVESLSQLTSNRQAMLFLAVWLGLNVFLGVFPQSIGVSGVIAWEAHLGGFLAGLFTFGLFDRAARRVF